MHKNEGIIESNVQKNALKEGELLAKICTLVKLHLKTCLLGAIMNFHKEFI